MKSILADFVRSKVAAWLLPETRSSLENPSTPLSYPAEWLLDIFNGGRTDSGLRVSEMTALQVSTVFACVQLIASAIGFLPFHVFEWVEAKDRRRGKRIAYDHDIYDLLRYEPNPEMTALTFRKCMQSHALLWGNCYAEVQRDQGNRAVALWPRNPARTRPYRVGEPTRVPPFDERVPAGTLIYKTTEGQEEMTDVEADYQPAAERIVAADDMLHIPGLALDGRLGQSTVQLARQAVGLALATEKYGAKYFGNGARPSGVLTHPGALEGKAHKTLLDSWAQAQGGENAHKIAILENGMKFEPLSAENEGAQFLQTREFQRGEVCSVFAVPPHMIGDTGKQNRANTEQIGLEFVTFTLGPWLESWQQEIKRKLFPTVGRNAGRYFPKFETRQLTMPDADARRNFYASMRQWGWGSANDVREYEDLNPIQDPAADAFWMPVNMQVAGYETPGDIAPGEDEPPPDSQPADTAGEGDKETNARLMRLYGRLFRDAMTRLLGRSRLDSEAFRRAFGPIFASIAEAFGAEDFDDAPFAAEYFAGMATRLDTWRTANGNFDDVVARELAAALRAIRAAVRFALSRTGSEVI